MMGGTSHDDAILQQRLHQAAITGQDAFAHTSAINSGTAAAAVHPSLDVRLANKAGQRIRESRDSAIHPDSKPVAIIFDVTGSMGTVPRILAQEKLGKLMGTLVKKDLLPHPHVLFGAVGDAGCDSVPLQIGQFEGGNEMDDALMNIFLESGGGGNGVESYDLALYYLATHADLDCFTKRGEKGYLFIIGDEGLYTTVRREWVKDHIGDTLERDIPIEEIIAKCSEKFEIFWIRPRGTQHFNDPSIDKQIKALFPERVIVLDQPGDVCEVVATTIGMLEGHSADAVTAALKSVGADAGAITRATTALAPVMAKSTVAVKGKVDGDLAVAGSDGVERL